MSVEILVGDCRDVLKTLPEKSVQCVVTSPPYFGLRDYNVDGQIGLESTVDAYVAELVAVFREVRRVLADDGTCWVNLGDSYASSPAGNFGSGVKSGDDGAYRENKPKMDYAKSNIKPKDLIGIPWTVARALQEPYYTGRIKRMEDRVWLAAMIDAEGCLFIHKRKAGQHNGQGYYRQNASYGSGMEISNTSEAVIQRVAEIVGKGSICTQGPNENHRRKQTIYRWNLRTNECRDVVREVYPYLVAKRQQARILIGCPSSGERAEAAHAAMIHLHNGTETSVDFPEPAPMFEQGWFLRSDIIWNKPNPMPESVRDRPTKAHEYLFMFSKSAKYFYDADAIAEPTTWDASKSKMPDGWDTGPGGHGSFHRNGREKGVSARDTFRRENSKRSEVHPGQTMGTHRPDRKDTKPTGYRNKRSVWTIATKGYKGAHFATFPPSLVEPCILAGSRPDDIVLDPFGGSGTTAQVAIQHGRHAILIELNPEYVPLIEERIATPIKPVKKPKKQAATTPDNGQMELFSHEL